MVEHSPTGLLDRDCRIIHIHALHTACPLPTEVDVMHYSRMSLLLLMAGGLFLTAANDPAWPAEGSRPATPAPMTVQGEIVAIRADAVVVKTPQARYTVKKKTVPLNAALGDKITLSVTSGHAVIDHHRQDTGRRHRFITGTLLETTSTRQIKLWTPDADMVYSLARQDSEIALLTEGTMVTVEVDEADAVITIRAVEAEVSACDKRHHCKVMLHGTVNRIEDGMIFIHTPVVEYEVPAAVAPRDTAPNDEMTLWVNENNVVLNYHRAGEPMHRRFVTGVLHYADRTKSHIKLWTPEGEKIFSLSHGEKAGLLQEGRPITVEISEAGAILDFWQSS